MNTSKTLKSAYSAPQLTVHGNVESLTRGDGNGHYTRGGGGGNAYGYGHCRNAGNPGHPEEEEGCALS